MWNKAGSGFAYSLNYRDLCDTSIYLSYVSVSNGKTLVSVFQCRGNKVYKKK